MLRFKPTLASKQILVELTEEAWLQEPSEIEALACGHLGVFASADPEGFVLEGNWDWYFVSSEGGEA